ncbi:MAG: glycosyltransferase family 4 protein [Acidimicrobiales bacterium]
MTLRIALSHVYAWPEVHRGGERYMHELGGALAQLGHQVRIVTTAPRPAADRILGVEVQYLRRRRVLPSRLGAQSDEVAFGAQALTRLAAAPIDVWHAMGTADAAAASLVSRVRNVRSAYTDLGFPYRESRERRPDRRLHEQAVRHLDHYICFSQAAGDHLASGYGRAAEVVPGGVDVDRFAPAARRHPAPALLFAADASEPRKNLPLLLEAVAILRRAHPDLEVWVAGRGDQAALLSAAPAAAQEAAVLLGDVAPEDMIDLYGRAWVMVLPSEAEAFGLVYVEALACGTPVVGLDRGGPAEIIRPGIGAAAQPTPESVAEACELALGLAARPDIAADCRAAAREWDWKTAIVPRLLDLYQHPRRT